MRKDTRTRDQLLSEIDRLRRGYIIEEVGQTLRLVVIAGCVGFVAWCGKEAIANLAGLQTDANVSVAFLGRMEVAAALSLGVGALGAIYGLMQRSLRRKTVRRLQSRVQEYERRSDPRRTSSMLTAEGGTNPEDE